MMDVGDYAIYSSVRNFNKKYDGAVVRINAIIKEGQYKNMYNVEFLFDNTTLDVWGVELSHLNSVSDRNIDKFLNEYGEKLDRQELMDLSEK